MVQWLFTDSCLPPHRVTDKAKYLEVLQSLTEFGWWGPALVGYYTYDRHVEGYCLQLLTGENRWAAARTLRMKIPVLIFRDEDVEAAWGDLDKWQALIAAGDRNVARTREFFGV